ncbi:NAD(P)-dependent oxidoreductase [Arthrobacter mobilis]|uniref:NAD(P)H-binding protein n=1 Tax=Arthrobacter mobilis TaxID=2724944 RepID=A0A7X6HBT6_9MICC|nr:NAD(P)H-binding protein [Arthrobacter mobilis]NKX54199.1 NAD(P)H-binding protein [Arthrobacter mobilis]
MKIAVYGATGMVGSEITAEALRRGHEVTAVTRSGSAAEGASARTAELSDLDAFQELAAGHDAVVVSVAPDRTGQPHDSFMAAHRAIAGTSVPARVFVVGGAGATEVDGVQLKDLPGFPEAYKPEATTMAEVLDLYRTAAGLDWTMLAPAPVIAPGERTGSYKTGLDSPAGDSISSQDFAIAVLDELEEPKHRNRRFTAAN